MARINPHNLQMQISRLFQEGQGIFAPIKVQDWLISYNHNPEEYDILFHKHPAPPGSNLVISIEIELRRKDGQPVDSWLQEQVNLRS